MRRKKHLSAFCNDTLQQLEAKVFFSVMLSGSKPGACVLDDFNL